MKQPKIDLFLFGKKQYCLLQFNLEFAVGKRAYLGVFYSFLCIFDFLLHFEADLFVSVFSYNSEKFEKNETNLSLVSKNDRNKRETDSVSVIFGLNRNFFCQFLGHPNLRFSLASESFLESLPVLSGILQQRLLHAVSG